MIIESLIIILADDEDNDRLLFIDAEKGIENRNHHLHDE